jgi:hypothetical protein
LKDRIEDSIRDNIEGVQARMQIRDEEGTFRSTDTLVQKHHGENKFSFTYKFRANEMIRLLYVFDKIGVYLDKAPLAASMDFQVCSLPYENNNKPLFCPGVFKPLLREEWQYVPIFQGEEQESAFGHRRINPGFSTDIQFDPGRQREEEFETTTGQMAQDAELAEGTQPAPVPKPAPASPFSGAACSLTQTQDTSATAATLFVVFFTMALFLAPMVLVRKRRK